MHILISNISIFEQTIGSWITQFRYFLERNPGFFDYILSPDTISDENLKVICSKKRPFISYRFFKNKQLINYVAKDYINNLNLIIKKYPAEILNLVIIDDLSLLKAVTYWKSKYRLKNISIIFSFHGHLLQADRFSLNHTDQILFLTSLGYLDSLKNNFSFPPKINIIGNGINSNVFFPLTPVQKKELRYKLNIPPEKKVITWLANDRPEKGLHIFREIIERLQNKFEDLFFVIIGSNRKIDLPNTLNAGRILNKDVAKYLQVSDYYFHTALVREGFGLTIAEALKTGNIVLASDLGGIKEVINARPDRGFLIQKPNLIENWIDVFEKIYKQDFPSLTLEEAKKIWDYLEWEKKFIQAVSYD